MQYDKGYVSPYFVSDTDKMEVEMDNPLILVTNQKITNLQEILPLLEQVLKTNKPLLLVAEDYENEAISSLVLNKLRGAFNVVATKAPGFGDKQKEMLEDIAVLTGAKFYNKDLNMKLSDLTIEDLGTIKKVIVKKDNTTLIGHSSSEAVNKRVEELKTQLTHIKSDYEKKTLKERIGKLSNGVATIKVGATTEAELKEKKLRIEDALNATKAAVDEGIVVGGGAALVEAYEELKNQVRDTNVDIQKGINVVMNSLFAPLTQIAINAGYDEEEIVSIQKNAEKDFGFDAKTGDWVNMFEAGIIDPTKVTRSALLNAASISALFLTTEAGVAELPKKEESQQPVMPQGGMY